MTRIFGKEFSSRETLEEAMDALQHFQVPHEISIMLLNVSASPPVRPDIPPDIGRRRICPEIFDTGSTVKFTTTERNICCRLFHTQKSTPKELPWFREFLVRDNELGVPIRYFDRDVVVTSLGRFYPLELLLVVLYRQPPERIGDFFSEFQQRFAFSDFDL